MNSLAPATIVFIPFPFSDLTSHKKQPVLLLTQPDERGDFICLAITSQPTTLNALALNTQDSTPSLPKQSWLRLDKVYTLNQALIVKSFGTLNAKTWQTIQPLFCDILFQYENS